MGPRNLLACGAWKESSSTQQTWSPGHSCKSITQDLENGSFSPCSVTQLCPALYDPMDCSTPGFPLLHYVLEFAQTHVHWVGDAIQPNRLILHCPPLLLPSIFPSIRVFSNELALLIRWPKYWSFSFIINPSNEYSELISFRIDWLDLLAVQRVSQESSPTPQFKSINSSVLGFLCSPTLTSIHDYWKNHSLD